MARSLYVTADWQRFVPEGDPDAAFGVALSDVDRLGLRSALDDFESKQARKPADKQARKPSNKAASKPADK